MNRPNIIVLDLETKRTFEDVGGRDNLGELGVSLVGVFSYLHNDYQIFWEADFPKLLSLFAGKPLVVGFNHKRFDLPVLQPYFKNFDLQSLSLLDILDELNKTLGHRVSLDSVAQGTLGTRKSGHGLDAIRYWNRQELDKLQKYCLDDVRITKEIYEYGAKHGELLFMNKFSTGKLKASVSWKLQTDEKKNRQYSLF